MPHLTVQPSELLIPTTVLANQWYRGIPTPGVPTSTTPIPAVRGQPDCTDLIRASPPTLLEEYQIVAFSIAWAVSLRASAFTATPNVQIEIALLINDRVAYSTSAGQESVTLAGGGFEIAVSDGVIDGDLINPLAIGARERLSLRLGLRSDTTTDAAGGSFALVAAQPVDNLQNFGGVESTITYAVLQLPAKRRL